ncbi:MAG TPA: PAS domain S-box protein [Planctomycetota bacterium]|nr:PAS domain S-box protein [Planctomycetota bacterium]
MQNRELNGSSSSGPSGPASCRIPGGQELQIGSHPYVLLPKPEFDRLLQEADLAREDASALTSASVGRDLRARRHAVRLTLAAVAGCAGIAPETLSRIENGRTNPSIATVRAILDALGRNGRSSPVPRLLATAFTPGPADVAAGDLLLRTAPGDSAEALPSVGAKSRLAAIVEGSDDAIISKTLDGIVTSWNCGAEHLFGYSAAEAVGRSITLIIPVERLPEEKEILAKISRGERLEHFETVRRRKDGSLVDISLSISPIKDGDGRIVGASKIARDITEQKRAHQEALRANAMLEDRVRDRTRSLQETIQELDSFAYTVAHDLRAPLRTIHSFGEILLADCGPKLTETEHKYLVEIVRAGARMDCLISDLLAYSRISRQDTPLTSVDLGALVDGLLMDLGSELAERRGMVEIERPLPRVVGHSVMIAQALTNLVSNALKFVLPEKSPRVRIWAERRPPGRVRLWVEDNGIGIAPEHQARLFKVFERLHGREAYPGTGIGLAIVRRAAERMGGSTGLVSTPGEGSRFWIELPEA